MRILLLSGEHPAVPGRTGGIGSAVAEGAAALAAAGHDVHVLVCAPGLTQRDLVVEQTHVHVRGLATPLQLARGSAPRLLAAALSTRWHARRLGRFDVVESPEWQALAAGFVIGSPPLVLSLQTPGSVVAAHDPRLRSPTRAADALERGVVRRAAVVLSASRLLADELRATGWLAADQAVEVAPPVVDLDRWASVPSAAGTGPVVLGIGRLEPRKGFVDLLEAVARVDGGPDLRVELVGGDTNDRTGGRYSHVLRSRAADLGVELLLHGEVPRAALPDVMAGARLVALPSRFDSFNMAGLEALAAGRAVVVSDRVGLRELDDGRGAITVVPAGSIDALTRAVAPYRDQAHAARTGALARTLAGRHDAGAFVTQREDAYRRAGAT